MRTKLLTAFILLFSTAIGDPASTQGVPPTNPAVEQLAMTLLFPCPGANSPEAGPCQQPILMDIHGSNEIPMPAGEWSPDGTRLLVSNGEINVMSPTGVTIANLTNHPAYDFSPDWSPDGTRIAFASNRDGPLDLYVMNADGSGVVRVNTGVGMAWDPTWSPDGTRLAFTCVVDPVSSSWWTASDNVDICAINADGSGFARLTSEPGVDSEPDWSPDGDRILFATDRYGTEIVVMNPDGSDLTRVSPGVSGGSPRWSPDGTRIAFVYFLPIDWDQPWLPWSFVFVMNADGTDLTELRWAYGPISWRPSPGGPNDRPVAAFTFDCTGTTCTLDGSPSSDSDGTIASYGWQFDDGTMAWGATVTHTFAGSHNVRLIVMDDEGALATVTQSVNQLPVVSFTTTCTGLTCTFDGSAAFDPDGSLYYFHWGFGDWTDRSGYVKTVTHTYAAPGTYTVRLTAWDSESDTASSSQTITVGNVNVPPIASFGSTCSGLTCSFTAAGSSDPDGTIASYSWQFGDGTTGSGATASRTYTSGGAHSVTLIVTDNRGAASTSEQTVTVAPPRVGPRIAYDQCWADAGNWEVVCDTHVLVDGSETLLVSGQVGPKWSPDGSRIAFGGGEISVVNLADGSLTYLTHHPANDSAPAWSRDGRIAFVSDRDGSVELYVMDGNGSNPARLTHNAGFTGAFRWSPDGSRIAFAGNADGSRELYVMAADGSSPTPVTHNVGFNGQIAWSSDANRIAFGCEVQSGNPDICSVNTDGSNFVRLTSDPAADSGAVFSPVDGRIAFETARFGASEIAIMEADGSVRRLAPGTGGRQPVWSPDGGQLVFVATAPCWYSGRCCPQVEGGACNADDFCMAMYDIYLIHADGTGRTVIATGANADWFAPLPGRPEAAYTHHCTGTACGFDGTGSVDYNGTIASYAWQFGDGTSGSGATPSHTYTHGNRYTATLTVTDNAGATGVVSMSVYANTPPSASFIAACTGPRCTFNGAGASDSDGTISSHYWLFGDGESAFGPTATHTYTTGTFSVSLYVVDNAGGTATTQQTVSVVNAPPVASFTRTCNGLTCTFNGSASADPDGTIANYSWSFGDGTSNPWGAPTASHAYAAAGTYSVTLTVTGNNYGTGTQSQTVSVAPINAPPIAAFTSACGGLSCSFNASASRDPDGTIASYAWNFGDGTTGSGAAVNRTYAVGGAYTVTLTVRDNGGATSTQVQGVTAVSPPEVHVGDLDRARTLQGNTWTATVTIRVHDKTHGLVANAVVSGNWTGGTTSTCTTNSSGQCAVSRSGIPKNTNSVSLTITSVTRAGFVYKAAANHDPDGDSNGTTVTVIK